MTAPEPSLEIHLKTDQRMAVLGRMKMAEWIEMREEDFAREIAGLEQDPLFRKLRSGAPGQRALIHRQRWPGGSMAAGFYEVNEELARGKHSVEVEQKLDARRGLVRKIRKLGAEEFERLFLHEEEALDDAELAERTGLKIADVAAIRSMLLEIGIETEFFQAGRDPAMVRAYSCLAEIEIEDGKPMFAFLSPHWGRGVYQIRYEDVETWKDALGGEKSHLRKLLKRVETINLRQNTMFRIMTSVTEMQAGFLTSHKPEKTAPVSLRMLARRLGLAPSTVSRALSGRSVRLPWGLEVPLIRLVPGRREVLRTILTMWRDDQDMSGTDAGIADRLLKEYGIRVSRRTVNAVRHEVDA